jgi:hypothetical protein
MEEAYKVKTYREILNELVNWHMHQLKEKHTLQELKDMQELFDQHRKELIKALEEKEKEEQ